MTTISDEHMRQMMGTTRPYSVVILKAGPRLAEPGAEKIVWEHGRRNFVLRAEGHLCIVCPVNDGSEVKGVGVFAGGVEEVHGIMRDDPGVKAGLFVYEVHATRSFPGDALPQ
jgi:hypothetical protein